LLFISTVSVEESCKNLSSLIQPERTIIKTMVYQTIVKAKSIKNNIFMFFQIKV